MNIAESLKAWSSRIEDTLSAVERQDGAGDFTDDDSKDAILRLSAVQPPLADRLERAIAECEGRQLAWLRAFPQYDCYASGCGHEGVVIRRSTEQFVDAYCPSCGNNLLFPGFDDTGLRHEQSRFCESLQSLRRQVETVASLTSDSSSPTMKPAKRKYTKVAEAEALARRKFKVLWRSDNKSEWAREIGCDDTTVEKLQAWEEAKRKRAGWQRAIGKMPRTIDSSIIDAIYRCDMPDLSDLSAEDRARIDSMTETERAAFERLKTEQMLDDDY